MPNDERSTPLHELPLTDQAGEIIGHIETMLDDGRLVDEFERVTETQTSAIDGKDLKSLLEQIRSVDYFEEEMERKMVWLVGNDTSGNKWKLYLEFSNEAGYRLRAHRYTGQEESTYLSVSGDFDEAGNYTKMDVTVVDHSLKKYFGKFHFSTQEH